MSIQTAYSTKPLPDAVAELQTKLEGRKPRVVLFFASAGYDPVTLSERMQNAFPDACVAGCSTAGEIAECRMLTGSVVAMALDDETVEDAAAVAVENLGAQTDVRDAFASLEDRFQAGASTWDVEKHVGLVLMDGLSGAEERLIEKLGDTTDVFFVGGSAGDDLKFARTHVYAGGKAYANAAVLVLLRLRKGFAIVKTQSFRQIGKSLTATAVDEARRSVIEFDHKPALDAYAEALGVPPPEAATRFFLHPLGLMVDGEPFVRSPQKSEGGAIVFYCHIKLGMNLEVLEATDIVADTRRAIEAQKAVLGPIAGLIDFQCILRTLQLLNEKRCDQYGAVFAGIPNVGFSTYGEAYLGHLNQTSTILLFR
jgi:hypothetical protein